MMKKVLLLIGLLFFAFSYFQSSVSAYESKNEYINFPENTQRTRTKTVQLPFVDSIQSVTVDNGNVSYDLNGDMMTLTVSNGDWVNREAYYDPEKYSKYATTSRTSSSSSFPSSISHSSDGHSGTISKSGSSYVISGSYTPSDSKVVERIDSSTSTGYSWVDYKCSDGSWVRVDSYKTADKGSRSYNSGGYSGTLYYVDHWSIRSYDQRTSNCSDGDTARWHNENNILFRGTVTKPAVDTRTWKQDYSGTIYKGGTSYRNHTYAYEVVVSYEEHTLTGSVYHTNKWKNYHDSLSHPSDYFYSGEKFLLLADVNNLYEISSVHVDFIGKRIDGAFLELDTLLTERYTGSRLYDGMIYDSSMSDPKTLLDNEDVYFLFTANWENGESRQQLVKATIIDNVFNRTSLYRTN